MARRAKKPRHTGVLLIDKSRGVTSHDVIQVIRKRFGQRQVGHTGTLDPLATGLMVVTLGKATRIAQFIEATDKTYRGVVRLGRSTTTQDAEGETVEETIVPPISSSQIQDALTGLKGTLVQTVPAFSAVKVQGEPLYAKARRGESFSLPTRQVQIHDLELLDTSLPCLTIETRVSKGTYIRSLAVQIGEAFGLPAHLEALHRTMVGVHRVADACGVDDPQLETKPLMTMRRALDSLPMIQVNSGQARRVAFGQPLRPMEVAPYLPREAEAGTAVGIAVGERLLAVARLEHDMGCLSNLTPQDRALRYACVLVDSSELEP